MLFIKITKNKKKKKKKKKNRTAIAFILKILTSIWFNINLFIKWVAIIVKKVSLQILHLLFF